MCPLMPHMYVPIHCLLNTKCTALLHIVIIIIYKCIALFRICFIPSVLRFIGTREFGEIKLLTGDR